MEDSKRYFEFVKLMGVNRTQCLYVKWDSEDNYIAGCYEDGVVRVYNPFTGNLIRSHNTRTARDKLPVTACSWRPDIGTGDGNKHVLTAVNVEGTMMQMHGTKGDTYRRMDLPGCQFLSLDYNPDGTAFCTGSSQANIRIVDEATWDITRILEPNDGNRAGHSSRIFSTTYLNEHQIISGGWDDHVHIWDVRSRHVTRTFLGPHVCGDSIQVVGDKLIVGSNHVKDQIYNFSLSMGNLISKETLDPPCAIYSIATSKLDKGKYFAAVGSNSDRAYIVDTETLEVCSTVKGYDSPIYGVDYANQTPYFCMGCEDGSIQLFRCK